MAKRKIAHDHPELLGMPEVRKLWQTEGLFSDHYLKARLSKNAWWPSDADAEPVWAFCKKLYELRYLACAKNNEAFTRQELLNPILAKLGFAWTDNLSLPDQDAEPDYILFASQAEKELVIDKDTARRYRAAAGLLEAKKLHHPLSQISKHQQRYPHQQIRDYLNEAQVLTWGILTNGNEWRLYSRDTKPSHCFALNFEVALKSLDSFKVFLALFSAAAFARDALGKCRLDAIRESALAAQSQLESDLRQRIFGLVELLANGFAERPENGITDADLPRLYSNCLIFLYRLLFILYAEGRDLLPVERPNRKYYKQLSLARLVGPLKSFAEYDSRTQTRLYRDVLDLCHVINGTNEKANKEFDVPRYNGGLFDPDRYADLERWALADAVLADVLRGLIFNPLPSREQPTLPIETVDYADLSVQQLGSIYEGLMEHHFEWDKLPACQGGASFQLANNQSGKLEACPTSRRLVLKSDNAERRQTGTYYTPDYIVKYIVEHTVGPLLAEIGQRPEVKAAKENAFANEVLRLNICDPAMGSGHFLVEATTYLADHIVYHPTTKFQAEFQRGRSQEETEIAYWRRRVVEACIYGVDLNPLAVELAKLSLWLTTIASDQPLNFLDHHLRCGNSLIGSRLDQLGRLPGKKGRARPPGAPQQIEFTFGPDFKKAVAAAIREINRIEAETSSSVDKVKDKEKVWQQKILPALAPYKQVADLWTSAFFGNALDEETYVAQAQRLLKSGTECGRGLSAPTPPAAITSPSSANPQGRGAEAPPTFQTIAATRRFFHWELEFPDVFFGDDGAPKPDPGFDAVIGNPPYVGFHGMEGDKPWLRAFYVSCVGKFDIYVAFIERCMALLQGGKPLCFICPSTFMKRDYAESFRSVFSEKWALETLVDFGSAQIFADATNYTCIPLIRNEAPHHAYKFGYSYGQAGAAVVQLPSDLLKAEGWILAEPQLLQPLAKLLDRQRAEELDQVAASISEGIVTGCNDVFVVGEDLIAAHQLEPKFLKRLLSGAHIYSYGCCWEGEHVIYPYQSVAGKAHVVPDEDLEAQAPNLWKYLRENRARLSGRDYFDRSTKRWYELWNQRSFSVQAVQKIVVAEIELSGNFTIADKDHFYGDTVCGIIPKESSVYAPGYLLALLNSAAVSFVMRAISVPKANGYLIFKPMYLRRLPIRRIAFTTDRDERRRESQRIRQAYERGLASANDHETLDLVRCQLAAKTERADVVHDVLDCLAQQMLGLNQLKEKETRGFLTWLERQIGAEVDVLANRTKIQSYYEHSLETLMATLDQNREKLSKRVNPTARAFQENLEPEFEQSFQKVAKLRDQIFFTEKLIDQIVLELYGLTNEEALIVMNSRTKSYSTTSKR